MPRELPAQCKRPEDNNNRVFPKRMELSLLRKQSVVSVFTLAHPPVAACDSVIIKFKSLAHSGSMATLMGPAKHKRRQTKAWNADWADLADPEADFVLKIAFTHRVRFLRRRAGVGHAVELHDGPAIEANVTKGGENAW